MLHPTAITPRAVTGLSFIVSMNRSDVRVCTDSYFYQIFEWGPAFFLYIILSYVRSVTVMGFDKNQELACRFLCLRARDNHICMNVIFILCET